MPVELSHHCEQQWPNSCIPACIGIILKWRGAPFAEVTLHAGAYPKGHNLGLAEYVLQAELVTPSPAFVELYQRAPLWFAEDCALIVKICGPAYVQHMGVQPGGHPSRHGDLASPGCWGAPFHTIVLIGQTAGGFLALDPYYPAAGQPLELTDDVMNDIFVNSVVVCKK